MPKTNLQRLQAERQEAVVPDVLRLGLFGEAKTKKAKPILCRNDLHPSY